MIVFAADEEKSLFLSICAIFKAGISQVIKKH
jgi:hypothetical protein